jgi:pimeloyl-ACP methyl ester carboxylesterase
MAEPTTPPTILHRRRIERDGEVIYYELAEHVDDDRRPLVVLTHGAGGSHAVWFHQVPVLAERFRVLTWDSRGFGNSTCRSGEVSVEAAVEDLGAILAECGRGEPAHLVGQSMGGWWVVGFALAQPGRVRSLTLSDTPGGVWTPALREHFSQRRVGGGSLRSDVVGIHPALGATTMARQPAQAFLYQQLGSFFEPPMAAVLKVLGGTEVAPAAVQALGIPLLVVAGEEDTIFPAPLLRELAGTLGARYVELAAAGHSPYFESPDAYNEALLAFLG